MKPSNPVQSRAASFDGGLVTVPLSLLAALGEHLAAKALTLMQQQPAPGEDARVSLQELEQLGLELQGLVRSLGAKHQPRVETLDLLQALKAALPLWHASLQQHGLRMQVQGDAAPLEMDPVLLQHALDLLIGHGLSGAQDFCLRAQAGTPASLRLSGLGAAADDAELHWQLLRLLSRSCGWRLARQAAPGTPEGTAPSQIELVFGKPAPAAADEGLPRRQLAPDLRVLVIDPNELSRVQCARLLGEAGVPCDCAASLQQAEDALQHGGAWTAVVSGFALEEAPMQALAERLQQHQPQEGPLRWVELVDQAHEFALGTPDGSRPARIARADLVHTLLAALAV